RNLVVGAMGDLRVLNPSGYKWFSVDQLPFDLQAFVKFRPVERSQICLFWYPFGTRFRRDWDPKGLAGRKLGVGLRWRMIPEDHSPSLRSGGTRPLVRPT